jgi:integrase/recombinase XerD
MQKNAKNLVRKYSKGVSFKKQTDPNKVMLSNMFEKFMNFKETEGLTEITLNDYKKHFNYFLEYTNGYISSEELNLDVFLGFIGFMLHNKDLSPVTANVRIRTMRAFIRYCYMEGWIQEPILERNVS